MKEKIKAAVSPMLLVMIFLIPLQNIHAGKIPSFGAGINILNILMVLTIISSLFIKETGFKTPLNKYFIAMILTYFISWINSISYIGTYDDKSILLLKDIYFGYMVYFVVFKTCHTVPQLKRVFWATILPLPYMFRVYYSNLSWMSFWHYNDKLRLNSGTFMYLGSNEINAFYATYTFVLLSVALSVKNISLKLSLIILAIMNIFCVIYGYSRGAYVSILLGIIVWCVVSSKLKLVIASILFLATISVVGIKLFPQAAIERFDTIMVDVEERDKSAESRFEYWKIALKYWKDNPVFGIGLLNFPKVNPSGKDTHNYYIKLMVENGTVGLISFLLFLTVSWRKIRELYSVAIDPFLKAFSIGMMPCIVSIMVGNLFGDRFTPYPLISYYFVYMAIVVRGISISKDGQRLIKI